MSPTFRERGFAAITAVFIIVVLAGMGVAVLTVSTAQQRGAVFDLQASKAYQGARAGLEYAVFQALQNASCAAASLSPGGNLAGFSVNVSCASTTHDEGGTTLTMYELTATACNRPACPGTADAAYVERQLRATVASSAP